MSIKLYNKKSKDELIDILSAEKFNRITCSFYNYVNIKKPENFRNSLYLFFQKLNILGRVYIAKEGINAQISVPDFKYDEFLLSIKKIKELKGIAIKKAVSESTSFYKLKVKVKKELVAYKLSNNEYNMKNIGQHISAEEFNEQMELKNTAVVDMRNFYESEVGRFKNAMIPMVEKSKDLLPEVRKMLKGKENHQVLLYCTGGIRCEKASSYLIKHGFNNVKQLKGGIIQYAHEIKEKNIGSNFIGKNFVFDERLGERITDDIISNCHVCGKPSDNHRDCNYLTCHILFIQCNDCEKKLDGCCSKECKNNASKTIDEQKKMREKSENIIKRRYYRKPGT